MLVTKALLKRSMAILVCTALVSLFLPATSSPADKNSDSTTSSSWLARQFLIASISMDIVKNGLTSSDQTQNDSSNPRNVQGTSKSKKKPKSGGD